MATDNLKNKISIWLNKHGYPHEMEVAKLFSVAGFQVIQSEYYIDNESKATREVDIIADINKRYNDILIKISFVVECKTNKDKPWIVFTSSGFTFSNKANISQRAASKLGRFALLKLLDSYPYLDYSFFQNPERGGYNLIESFQQGKDIAYSSLFSVTKATLFEIKESNKSEFPICHLLVPIIVLNGKLYECYLDNENIERLDEVGQHTSLFWRNRLLGMPHSIILVETIESLKKHIKLYTNHSYKLIEEIYPIINDIRKEWEKPQSIIPRSTRRK